MISAADLQKTYHGFCALDGVSLTIGKGTIFGVIGHNGAGKTTLLKILTGLITPTSGTLTVNGIDAVENAQELKKILGYLPEESRLYDSMTAHAYLSFFGEIYGLDRARIRYRTDLLLGSLSLEPDGKKLGELSKGMRRKVAIARSLLHDPELLVYDEATSGLDPMTSRYIAGYLGELRRQGKTIVLSAHNLYQVEQICDRVLILRRGKAVACGTMKELRDLFGSITYTIWFSPGEKAWEGPGECIREGSFCHVDADNVSAMNRITAEVTKSGGVVDRIESHSPTLEEMLVIVGK
ncbi:MAG: ABC transporter ATP-binding protein [Methanomicrobiales archaeon]|nr:ABC transporter ATP-binding protein [Methanomicrobiales archaeon]